MADLHFSEFMAEFGHKGKSIEMPDGSLIEFPPLELVSDDCVTAAKENDVITLAQTLVGEESYKKWKSFGGNASSLLSAFAKVHNTTLPNSLSS